MRASASTSALLPPSDTLSAEQRKQRLIESRKKYSTRPANNSSLSSSSKNSTSKLAPPPPNLSRPLAPRMSRAPSDSQLPRNHLNPRQNQNLQNSDPDDFRIDHRSMAMIESGNVVIPRRDHYHRPSMYGRGLPRNTIGGMNNSSRPLKFRNSIAPQQEPRQSLFPLGINIFTASEAQKSEVEGWLKERIEAATPAKQGSKTPSALLLDATTKSIQRIVRFKEEEATPPEIRSDDGENDIREKENQNQNLGDSKAIINEMRIKKSENFTSPVSILKVERKKTTTFSATPIPTRRRINFDDVGEDDEEEVTTTSKGLQNPQNPEDSKKRIEELRRIVSAIITDTTASSPSSSEIEELQKIAENLAGFLKKFQNAPHSQKKTASTSSSSLLVPICEDEEEEDVKTFEKLKIGEMSPQKLLQQQPLLSVVDFN